MQNNSDHQLHDVEEYQEVPDKKTGRDFSIGLIFGLLIGSVVGLFIAPKSGEALRDDIQTKAEALTKNTNAEAVDPDVIDLKQRADETTAQLRAKLNEEDNGKSE